MDRAHTMTEANFTGMRFTGKTPAMTATSCRAAE
jgi:hypothetical protein